MNLRKRHQWLIRSSASVASNNWTTRPLAVVLSNLFKGKYTHISTMFCLESKLIIQSCSLSHNRSNNRSSIIFEETLVTAIGRYLFLSVTRPFLSLIIGNNSLHKLRGEIIMHEHRIKQHRYKTANFDKSINKVHSVPDQCQHSY